MQEVSERAGGAASNGRHLILEIMPAELHQRVPFFIGSKKDVAEAERFLSGERV